MHLFRNQIYRAFGHVARKSHAQYIALWNVQNIINLYAYRNLAPGVRIEYFIHLGKRQIQDATDALYISILSYICNRMAYMLIVCTHYITLNVSIVGNVMQELRAQER